MRYSYLRAVGLLGVLIGWAQVTPWPLEKWGLYEVDGAGQLGPPLPEAALVWPSQPLRAIVDTTGMGAQGIQRWRWEVCWAAGTIRPYINSTAETLSFSAPTLTTWSLENLVRLWVIRGSDSAYSSRVIVNRRIWTTLPWWDFWACAGGTARVCIQDMGTDVDSARIWIEREGQVVASTMLRGPGFWDFPAPAPGAYQGHVRLYVRGVERILPRWDSSFNFFVVSSLDNISAPIWDLVLPGQACPGEPVSMALHWKASLMVPPLQPPTWDFEGDGQIEAYGWEVSHTYPVEGTYTVQVHFTVEGGCSLTLARQIQVGVPHLGTPTLSGPASYRVGTPVPLRVSGWQGLLSYDIEDDGTWEGIGVFAEGNQPVFLPPYIFSQPPPERGYAVRVRQVACGRMQDTTLYWRPSSWTPGPPAPSGVIRVVASPRCPGDRVRLRLDSLWNFIPGAPGYYVVWKVNDVWGPYVTRTETTLVWQGGAMTVSCLLTHPNGTHTTLPPVAIQPISQSAHAHLFLHKESQKATWSPVWDEAFCPSARMFITLPGKEVLQGGQWHLKLPTGTLVWPLSEAPDTFYFSLPAEEGIYTVESELHLACGIARNLWILRTEAENIGRPAAYSDEAWCTPHQRLVVCQREPLPLRHWYALEHGAGGFQGVRWVYADGSPAEAWVRGKEPVVIAPARSGEHLLYQIWESCGGRQDTQRIYLVVREAEAPYFTIQPSGCVGVPVEVRRESPQHFRGWRPGIEWRWGDGTRQFDTTRTLSHIYTAPGTYTVAVCARSGECNGCLERPIRIVAEEPIVKDFKVLPRGLAVEFEAYIEGADSIVWDFGDGHALNGVLRGSHRYTQPGFYTLRVWASNSCGTQEKTQRVTVWEVREAGPWRLFPNPASGRLWVEVPLGDGGSCIFYTINGQQVAVFPVQEGLNLLDVSSLDSGLYVVQFVGRGKPQITRLKIE